MRTQGETEAQRDDVRDSERTVHAILELCRTLDDVTERILEALEDIKRCMPE